MFAKTFFLACRDDVCDWLAFSYRIVFIGRIEKGNKNVIVVTKEVMIS